VVVDELELDVLADDVFEALAGPRDRVFIE
jgi:hypothetical protein